MAKGTVARLMDKGYGFIKQEDSDKDLFFHANELQDIDFNDLHEGDAVTFEVAEGDKGPNAVNLARA